MGPGLRVNMTGNCERPLQSSRRSEQLDRAGR
jgi:hypothetical protein